MATKSSSKKKSIRSEEVFPHKEVGFAQEGFVEPQVGFEKESHRKEVDAQILTLGRQER